jgi:hypothetical protein
MELSAYALSALRECQLYRGRGDGLAPILLVAPAGEYPSLGSLQRLEHEYAFKAELDAAWAGRPVALSRQDDRMMWCSRTRRRAAQSTARAAAGGSAIPAHRHRARGCHRPGARSGAVPTWRRNRRAGCTARSQTDKRNRRRRRWCCGDSMRPSTVSDLS